MFEAGRLRNNVENVSAAITRIKQINPTAWIQFVKSELADVGNSPELCARIGSIMFSKPIPDKAGEEQLVKILSIDIDLAISTMREIPVYERTIAKEYFNLDAMKIIRRIKLLFEPYNEKGERTYITKDFLLSISNESIHSALYGPLPFDS